MVTTELKMDFRVKALLLVFALVWNNGQAQLLSTDNNEVSMTTFKVNILNTKNITKNKQHKNYLTLKNYFVYFFV